MARIETTDTACLDAALRTAWNRLRGGDPAYASPYFSPEFYEAVAGVTRSARLMIAEDAAGPVALLPFQRRLAGMCGPIGGQLNDLHGLIAAPEFDMPPDLLLDRAGVPMLSLRHAPTRAPALGACFGERHGFHAMALEDGFAAYLARREPFAKSAFRTIRSRTDKARKAYGAVTCVFDDRGATGLRQLIAWKRDQYAATAQQSIFAIAWVRELIERLHTSRDPNLRGQLSLLYFGDALVAAHFGLRGKDVLHYWFPAYDPAFGELSPGNILLQLIAEAAAAEGCKAIHLGAGDYRYKHEFADCNFAVTDGVAFGRSLMGRTAAVAGLAVNHVNQVLPKPLAGLPVRALRRIDRQLAFKAA